MNIDAALALSPMGPRRTFDRDVHRAGTPSAHRPRPAAAGPRHLRAVPAPGTAAPRPAASPYRPTVDARRPEQRLASVAGGLRRLRGALAPTPGSPLDRVLAELSIQTERAHAEIDAGRAVLQTRAAHEASAPGAPVSLLHTLTARENEILGLMSDGHSNSAICKLLHLSPKTVETHVRNIFAKLELPPTEEHHRRVLAVLAYLRG